MNLQKIAEKVITDRFKQSSIRDKVKLDTEEYLGSQQIVSDSDIEQNLKLLNTQLKTESFLKTWK